LNTYGSFYGLFHVGRGRPCLLQRGSDLTTPNAYCLTTCNRSSDFQCSLCLLTTQCEHNDASRYGGRLGQSRGGLIFPIGDTKVPKRPWSFWSRKCPETVSPRPTTCVLTGTNKVCCLVVRRLFGNMSVGRGALVPQIWKISEKKVVLLFSSGKKQISPFGPLPRKFLEKPQYPPPEKILPTPCLQCENISA